ncbi:histidine phosphatase family protein [Dongia soli]|uniref:Histidine phosphatase family protein n=1 Tax=Dongia soli TaxID=600628 RepID=A0ABU5E688_9PROT|nr:histidine phosphatase family protein [Dongia soli]MDY0881407.1 histidine phosphatase family protein [Dongia soli]
MTQTVTRWWLVRHAPVVGAHGRIYGQDDLDCDCSDAALFAELAILLPTEPVWLVTPLRRTHATADAIHLASGGMKPEIAIEPDLAEQHFGDWQGLTYADLEARRDGVYHRFWHAPADHAPPNGESFRDVIARVSRAIDRHTRQHPGRDIVAVTHGGAIRAALAVALELDPERALGFSIDTCSITRIDRIDGAGEGASWRIVAVNRHPQNLAR